MTWHDKHIKKKSFKKGDWALLYDSRFQDFPGKLQTQWLGPYKINEVHDNGTVTLSTINGFESPFWVNGHWLRPRMILGAKFRPWAKLRGLQIFVGRFFCIIMVF
jgi:hypothetical protein